ncbi:MAG: hypothetical protein WCF73_22495, partial [Candidatus Sulfotelmatobacter sp.]
SGAELQLNRVREYLRKEAEGKSALYRPAQIGMLQSVYSLSAKKQREAYESGQTPVFRALPRPYSCNPAKALIKHVLASVKVCDCVADMQTGDLEKDAAQKHIDGAPRSWSLPLLSPSGKSLDKWAHEEAKSKGYDPSHAFPLFEDEDNREILYKLARIGSYLRSQIPPSTEAELWRAPYPKLIEMWQAERTALESDTPAVKVLEKAYKDVRFFSSVNLWLSEAVKREHPYTRVSWSLASFIQRFASYGDSLINGQDTDCEGFKRRVPFGSIGLPRLGSPEWVAVRSGELSLADNLHRHQEQYRQSVAEAIQDNPELYRANLLAAREPYERLRRPIQKTHKDNGTFRQGRAYRDQTQPASPWRVLPYKPKGWQALHAEVIREFSGNVREECPTIDITYVEEKGQHFEGPNRYPSLKQQAVPVETLDSFVCTEPYKQPDGGFGKEFFEISAVAASMIQKSNGAWYLAKTYRDNGNMMRKDVFIGVAKDKQGNKVRELIKKNASPARRKQQALLYCTKKGSAAFRAVNAARRSAELEEITIAAYSDDVNGRFQRDVNGHSGHVNKVGAQRRWDYNHARHLRD